MNLHQINQRFNETPIDDKDIFVSKLEKRWRNYFNDHRNGQLFLDDQFWRDMNSFFELAWNESEHKDRTIDRWGPGQIGNEFRSLVCNRQLVKQQELYDYNLLKKSVCLAGALAYLNGFENINDDSLICLMKELGII